MPARDIDHRVEHYRGKDPLGFVLSKNLHRRHLTESQRAMVAAKIATARQGERTDLEPSANLPKVTQAKAASQLDVSERSVRDAKTVQAKGVPELVEAVERGEASVSAAAEVAKLPEAEQRKAVASGKVKEKARAKRKKYMGTASATRPTSVTARSLSRSRCVRVAAKMRSSTAPGQTLSTA